MSKKRRKYEEEYEDDEEEFEEENEEDELIDELKAEAKSILREMRKLSKTSQEYMVLVQRLADITESKRNEMESIKEGKEADQIENSKYAWILPTIFQTAGNVAGNIAVNVMNRKNVKDMIKYEDDGYIANSKSSMFITKPRN